MTYRSALTGSVALAFVLVHALLAAQSTQSEKFEVASVKPQKPPFRATVSNSGIRYYEPGTTLWRLIEFAYDLPRVRVVGGPEWMDSELWSIEARSSAPATVDEMRIMVRSLLADRFELRARFERRELPVDELYLARQGGPLGPSVTRPGECIQIGARSIESIHEVGEIPCGLFGPLALGADGTTAFFLRGVTISEFARHLERFTGRVVRDRTGITGEYDIRLRYADGREPLAPARALHLAFPPALPDALREQLGMRLETTKASVDVLIIESVARSMPD